MNIQKDAILKAKEAIEFYQKRCNEQGFYSPNKQPIVEEALASINKALEPDNWVNPTPKEVYDLIRTGAADGGWQGFALSLSKFFKNKFHGVKE